jgi:hypothetical protein
MLGLLVLVAWAVLAFIIERVGRAIRRRADRDRAAGVAPRLDPLERALAHEYHCAFAIDIVHNPHHEDTSDDRHQPWSADVTAAVAAAAGGETCFAYERGITLPHTVESLAAGRALDVGPVHQGARDLRYNYCLPERRWRLVPKDALPWTLGEIRRVQDALFHAGGGILSELQLGA